MKKLIAFFIKYTVPGNVILSFFILFGFVGAYNMKSSFFPLTDTNKIDITVNYPGASPAEIEEGVVLKIEDNLRGLTGIERVTSTSNENSAKIAIETVKGYNIDVVLSDVKNAVDRVPSYPTGMEPIVISKNENVRETISFNVSGANVPLSTLKHIAREVENDLRNIDGISQITLSGFPLEEIEIALLEHELRAKNLSFNEVASAVSASNLLTTGGSIKTQQEDYLIRASHRSYFAKELDHIIVRANPNGEVIRLKDVATIRDKWNENPQRLYFNGDLAVKVTVKNTNSEDLLGTASKVNEYIENYNEVHDNVQLHISNDSSITLIQRTELLAENGGMGILLVLLLLALFLNYRLGFWVAFGLLIAFLGMFVFISFFNVTINVLSLFGMIIVIGILVDDGIVIAENIYHHYEKGKSPIQAAIDGTMEVIPPILSAILTTIIAFATFFFLDGRIGEFFNEVSTVVTITLVISLIEALIILPAHVAHSKALTKESKEWKPTTYAISFMEYMRDKWYLPTLKFFLQHKVLGFGIIFFLFSLTIGSIGGGIIKTTFFPVISSDRVEINLKMPQGTNEAITDSIISEIESLAWAINDDFTKRQTGQLSVIENVIKQIGPGSASAKIQLNLLPGESRDFPAYEISNALQKKVGNIPGAERLIFGSGSNFGGKPVSVSLLGNDISELKDAKTFMKEALSKNNLLKDVSDNDPAGIKEIKVKLNDKAYLLGLDLKQVMSHVRNGFFGFQAQRFQRGQDEIKVWVRYDKSNRNSIRQLDDMWIPTPSGEKVAFSEIANYSIERGEVAINHLDGQKEIKVEADLVDPKESASDILDQIKKDIIPELKANYPTVSALFEGQNREATKVANSAKAVIPIILFLIFAVIAFTFRSFSQPILLLIMVPFAVIGVAWGHFFHGFAINMLSWLGIIALIGIMVNDGLVLISKFNLYLKEGMKLEEAIIAAGKSRFRAIFLTSLTTMAGLAPLIFETSRQAQFLIPMAISIAYGIGIATVLTLIMLPLLLSTGNIIKVYFYWLLFGGTKPEREEVERAIKELKVEQDDVE
mgnify:CR=1 FL=1